MEQRRASTITIAVGERENAFVVAIGNIGRLGQRAFADTAAAHWDRGKYGAEREYRAARRRGEAYCGSLDEGSQRRM
jgi:hypothetical protein